MLTSWRVHALDGVMYVRAHEGKYRGRKACGLHRDRFWSHVSMVAFLLDGSCVVQKPRYIVNCGGHGIR